ncbi:hypothetical protein EMPG_12972 [Blastomyces silverae]|uniref:Uncharacterized protein n=1 Tax=Blastomyces silverae TaxID=2060906 RepID=A0A0H1BK47_9EURO|nr:hypothetical protein EMPG_12972 [Blastomyces silverae]
MSGHFHLDISPLDPLLPMLISSREAWDLFHSEQSVATARTPGIARPTTPISLSSIQQARHLSSVFQSHPSSASDFIPPENQSHATSTSNDQQPQTSQISSSEMMKELQSLRHQLRQLQVAGNRRSQAKECLLTLHFGIFAAGNLVRVYPLHLTSLQVELAIPAMNQVQRSSNGRALTQSQILSAAGNRAVTGDNSPTKATSSVTNASVVANCLSSDAHFVMLRSPEALQGMPTKLRGGVDENRNSLKRERPNIPSCQYKFLHIRGERLKVHIGGADVLLLQIYFGPFLGCGLIPSAEDQPEGSCQAFPDHTPNTGLMDPKIDVDKYIKGE